ncbi:MAG TPA: 4'-phosphopantetheinyl transferase superfamily protein [Hyphomicrobiaceae bacterium]|nr:4'-phosphopantetheinyl transferase superfamily protein [Hyphomicrobiaceae bacterium]
MPQDTSPTPAAPPTIDVWQWQLTTASDELTGLLALLSVEERDRAQRLVHEQHKTRFIAGRARLRQIIGNYLNVSPNEISFDYGRHGKPAIVGAPLSFNLSHAGETALAAFTRDTSLELGIDVEEIRPIERDLPKRYFSANEYAEIAVLTGDAWLAAFFNGWTRKEAVVKALGSGLSLGLAEFDVTLTPGTPPRLIRFGKDPTATQSWSLTAFEPLPGFVAALAIHGSGYTPEITHRQLADIQSIS